MAKMSRTKKILASLVVLAVVSAAGVAIYHKVTYVDEHLERLEPYAKTTSYDVMFEALKAQPPPPEGFRFVVLGDTRSNLDVAREVVGRAVAEKPVFILHTGDLVHPSTVDEYLTHYLPLVEQAAPIPLIAIPGNHENGLNRDFAGFKTIYGDDRFSFDYGDCRFVGVNDGDRLRLTPRDMRFLRTELLKPGAKHKFVLIHIPPDYMKTAGGRGFKWYEKGFRDLMKEAKVDYVYMAHIHGYSTEVIDGVHYTITGGGGAPLTDTLDPEGNVRNYIVVDVKPDGLASEAVRLLGDEWKRSPIP